MPQQTDPDDRPEDPKGPRVATDDAPGAEERSFQTRPGEVEPIGEDGGETYEPSSVEASRAREQGTGVGQKDLSRQRDANRPATSDEIGDAPDIGVALTPPD